MTEQEPKSECCGCTATFSHNKEIYEGEFLIELQPQWICDCCGYYCKVKEERDET